MGTKNEEKLLGREIEDLNEEIIALGYKLNELLSVDCSFGFCNFNPEIDIILDKIKEIQERKALLEHLKENIGAYQGEPENAPL
ncbi:MAG: hypothetical protein AB1611_14225 [bacterium]